MPTPNPKTLLLLHAIHHWLEDIFGEGTRLSDLLSQSGLTEAEIEAINTQHLTTFIEAILTWIAETPDTSIPPRNKVVMIRHYGLTTDGEPEGLSDIAQSVGVAHERIRQLVGRGLQFYREPERKEWFMSELRRLAREIPDTK